MAKKATKYTSSKQLLRDILDDQSSLMVKHYSKSSQRIDRLEHNIKELLNRLGEEVKDDDAPYYSY